MQNQELLQKLLNKHKEYAGESPEVEELILKAFDFARIVHYGELRLSGKSHLEHVLGTTLILTEIKMPTNAVVAGLLHDAYEFGAMPEDIMQALNPHSDIAQDVNEMLNSLSLMKGISSKYNALEKDMVANEYLRNLLLSVGRDIRVIIIRLAEKLDNLNTVGFLSPEKKERSLHHALNLYAPIADMLGISYLKSNIEEIAFKERYPTYHNEYLEYLNQKIYPLTTSTNDVDAIHAITDEVQEVLRQCGISTFSIASREKGIPSFHKKVNHYMRTRDLTRQEAMHAIQDVVAFRVLVNTVEECYTVLSQIANKFEYDEKSLDDYIIKPKPNGYRSVQLAVKSNAVPDIWFELQIRTFEMHEHNEIGPASHTYYKFFGSDKSVSEEKVNILKSILEWKSQLEGTSDEGQVPQTQTMGGESTNVESPKSLYMDKVINEIFVLTPKGDVIDLPKDSTPVDFAYAIHSTLGDCASGALINGEMKSLSYSLKSGDVVQILTRKSGRPNRDWLKFVKTGKARLHIKKKIKLPEER